MRSFYSPFSINAPFYGYLKLLSYTRKGKKSKQGCEIRESNSGPLAPRPRTNRLCYPPVRTVPTIVLRIGSAHLEILGFPIGGAS